MAINFPITPGVDDSFVIASGKIDTNHTSLQLVGHAAPGYGQAIAQSFVDLLTNFASNGTKPPYPKKGQLWYNNTTKQLLIFVGPNETGADADGWSGVFSTSVQGGGFGATVSQGGTGLTTVGAAGTLLSSNGTSLEYKNWWEILPPDSTQDLGAANQKFNNFYTKTTYSEIGYITNLTSNSLTVQGLIYGELVGNASSSDKWSTARQITLAGDLSGTVVFDGSSSVTLTATADPLLVLKSTGGTMTGPLVIGYVPTANNHAVPKSYVDQKASGYLPMTGGTLSGALVLANDATFAMGAVTKQQLDRVTSLYTSGVVAGNTADIFPPYGWSMADLRAFCPSINQIYFAGDVDGNDSLYCYYQILADRIRVIVYNSEQRSTPYANYIAVWRKQ